MEPPYKEILFVGWLLFILGLHIKSIYIIYSKNKWNFEPVHIFEIDILVSFLLLTTFAILFALNNYSGNRNNENAETCKFYLYGLLSHIYLNIGIVLAQLDRFLAVYWNSEYKQRVTPEMAKYSCGASKIIGLAIIALVAVFDPSYIRCTESYRNFIWTPTNVFLDCYPKLLVAFVLFLVSIYVSVVNVRLDRKVNSVVNIPTIPEEVVDSGKNTSRPQEINNKDPNMICELELNHEIPNLGPSSSKSNQAQRKIDENIDENITPVANVSTMQEKDPVDTQNASRIQRLDEDPNMFYQVDIIHGKPFLSSSSPEASQEQTTRSENQPKEPTTCFVIPGRENQTTASCLDFDYTEVMLVIKETLKNNLITAIFLIAILHTRFLAIIHFHKPFDDLTYVSMNSYLAPFRIILPMAHAVLIYRKLTKSA